MFVYIRIYMGNFWHMSSLIHLEALMMDIRIFFLMNKIEIII